LRLKQGDYAQAESTAARSNSWAGSDNALRADNWRIIAHARNARATPKAPRGARSCGTAEVIPRPRNPMTLKRPKGPAGTLLVLEHIPRSQGQPLRDPHVRKLGVWLPPQYDEGSKRRFPVLYDLVGFTGSGLATPTGGPSATTSRSARRGLSAREKWERRSSSCRIASPRSAATST